MGLELLHQDARTREAEGLVCLRDNCTGGFQGRSFTALQTTHAHARRRGYGEGWAAVSPKGSRWNALRMPDVLVLSAARFQRGGSRNTPTSRNGYGVCAASRAGVRRNGEVAGRVLSFRAQASARAQTPHRGVKNTRLVFRGSLSEK